MRSPPREIGCLVPPNRTLLRLSSRSSVAQKVASATTAVAPRSRRRPSGPRRALRQRARRALVRGEERLDGELGDGHVGRGAERRRGADEGELVLPEAQAQRDGDRTALEVRDVG